MESRPRRVLGRPRPERWDLAARDNRFQLLESCMYLDEHLYEYVRNSATGMAQAMSVPGLVRLPSKCEHAGDAWCHGHMPVCVVTDAGS